MTTVARRQRVRSSGEESGANVDAALRQLEELKSRGDAAFRAADYAQAERSYSSALARASELEPPPVRRPP